MLCSLLFVGAALAAPLKPHVVFFLADDYGFADVSYHTQMYGNSSNVIKTPHLDALALSGVRLENYYVQPVCSPTRSCIMTGRYVIHTGVHGAFKDASQNALPIEEVTVAQRLKAAGYATHAVGKWHLGFKTWRYTPQERGFDSFFGYYGGSTDYYTLESLCWPDANCFTQDTPDGEAISGFDLHRDREVISNNTEYSTTLFTAEAEKVIAAHAAGSPGVPLFLYLPYQAVHVGNKPTQDHPEYGLDQAPQRYIDEYSWVQEEQRRNLSAMVTVMDEAAGNVTAALREHGLWDKCLFIFSTDNGGPLNGQANNYPLKGGKTTLWEGGVRGIGFVVAGNPAWFGITTSGSVVHGLMHVSDWLPTLCDPLLADCDMSQGGGKKLDGVSAWNLIARNEPSARTEIVHDMHGSAGIAYRNGTLKLKGSDGSAVEQDWALYDVVSDVGETTNLFGKASYAKAQAAMLARVAFWLNESANVLNQDTVLPDPRANPKLQGGAWLPWLPDNCSDTNCPPPP